MNKKALYESIMILVAKIVKKAINESDAIKKNGTHRTYYLNMDLDTPKAGRTAPKISKDELMKKINETFWKYADEYDEKNHKRDKDVSLGSFVYKFVRNYKEKKDIKEKAELQELNIDLLKIYHDTENKDAKEGLRVTKSGIPYILAYMGGDWEDPILFMVYWDGKHFRGYIPERGNVYNRDTKACLGNNEEADAAFITKQFKEELGKDLNVYKIKKHITWNEDACIADFEARVKVK